ncbi:MAG: hypothetical protein IJ193_01500 [Bacilli bacterium]|nr:hypothetical protein [Bacilli bacterium]
MEGIVYCYTSPSGKKYIGQTIYESARRSVFNSVNRNYCNGGKIDLARRKYGPENFKYEVLERININNKEELLNQLNILEKYYINLFNTYTAGYNSTKGGRNTYSKSRSESQKGHVVSEETKKKMSEKAKLRGGPKLTTEQCKKRVEEMIKHCSKAVLQYSLDGDFIRE